MKVEAKLIHEVFNEIKALLLGVEEVFRDGEYVQEGIEGIASNINTLMRAFAIDHMTPVNKPTKQEHYFMSAYERLQNKMEDGAGKFTPEENTILFKARFYLFLKREVVKHDLPINVGSMMLASYIECDVVTGSKYETYFKTDYVEDMYRTIDIVANEIIAERKKHPQMSLSLAAPAQASSKSLIDIL